MKVHISRQIMQKFKAVVLSLGVLLCTHNTSCTKEQSIEFKGPLTFNIMLQQGTNEAILGSPENLLPTTDEDKNWFVHEIPLTLQAISSDGTVDTSFNSTVNIKVVPGELDKDNGQLDTVTFQNGIAEATVRFKKAYSETVIWFEDIGTDDSIGTYATAGSPIIHVDNPTISDIRYMKPDETCKGAFQDGLTDYQCAQLKNKFVEVRTYPRTLVVTNIGASGFYLTDCTKGYLIDENQPCLYDYGDYNSIFVYTHSKPYGIEAGNIVTELSGDVSIFYGSSQISFPTWQIALGVTLPLPEPKTLSEQDYCAKEHADFMESHESDFVMFEKLTIVDFSRNSELMERYLQYGQWPVAFEDNYNCQFQVITEQNYPTFDPLDHAEEPLAFVRGSVTSFAPEVNQSYDKNPKGGSVSWMLVVRSPEDLGCENCQAE